MLLVYIMATENVLTGRVKWFNNKSGYGFVTVILSSEDASLVGKDIFAHHSSIIVGKEQFRYLVQGEYVEFSMSKIEDDSSEHKFQTAKVRGINSGLLMCETRYEAKLSDKETDGEGKAPNWNVSRGKKRSSSASKAKV